MNKLLVNKIILTLLTGYFFAIVQISIFSLFFVFSPEFSIIDLILVEIIYGGVLIIFIYFILTKRSFRVYLSLIFISISGVVLGFFLLTLPTSLIELIYLGLFVATIVSSIFIAKFYGKGTIKLILLLFNALVFAGFCLIFHQKPAFLTVIEFSILFIPSLYATLLSFKLIRIRNERKIKLHPYLRLGLILSIIISSFLMILPIRVIVIAPKNNPQIVFWGAPDICPTDNATLDRWSANNIAYSMVFRARNIDSSSYTSKLLNRMNYLINHSVNFGISIGGDGEFYCSIHNAQYFHQYYLKIRAWGIANGIWSYVDFIEVDAETPINLVNDLEEEASSGLYLFSALTSDEEIEIARTNLSLFIKAIQDDGKEAGIIKLPSIQDQLDGDRDYNLLTQNIYQLDLNWDYSVSMVYRTSPALNLYTLLLGNLQEYDYISDESELLYSANQPTQPIQDFYSLVKFERESTEVNVPRAKRFMFIGTFDYEFRDTDYVKNKEYKLDLDICRHFDMDRVYIYKWRWFRYWYGREAGVIDLINHKSQYETWTINMFGYAFYRKLTEFFLYSVIDRLIVLS
ncbi:MAG: hypothetical protein U9Q73_01900 [Nanoarchaeota archaeon]|nr:hypothetical protein [Nanoarchaeota archaeon]